MGLRPAVFVIEIRADLRKKSVDHPAPENLVGQHTGASISITIMALHRSMGVQ
jgi:hypothetical protein